MGRLLKYSSPYLGRRRSLLAALILLIVCGCCNAAATAAATCSMRYVSMSAAASSFWFLCYTPYGAAAWHIYNDSGSGTAVSSAAGAGAAVPARIVHYHSIVHTECFAMVLFLRCFMWRRSFARSIFPNYLGLFVIFRHLIYGT